MILINGEYKNQIDITDRGFQYGDGLFETIAVKDGNPLFWDRHWQRLNAGCHKLKIPVPDADRVQQEAKTLCQESRQSVLKIIITRGSGGRGYRQPDCILPTRVLSLHAFPEYPANFKEQGVAVRFCETRLSLNRALAGIKHLNRLEQVLARAEWNDPSIAEGIMMDNEGHVIEGTMTNLFYIKNERLYTSSILQAGIAGIIRSIILTLTAEQGLPSVEHAYFKHELLTADEIFVCNSIIGIWPVNQIDDAHYPVGPKTRKIQHWLTSFTHEAHRR